MTHIFKAAPPLCLFACGLIFEACASPSDTKPATRDQQERQFDPMKREFNEPSPGGSPRQPGTQGVVNPR